MDRGKIYALVIVGIFIVAVALPLGIALTKNDDNKEALTLEYDENNGVQVLKIKGDLKMDSLIDANCRSHTELYEWLKANVTEGHDMPFSDLPIMPEFGCSSFTTVQDGKGYIGRNFDFYSMFGEGMMVAFEPSGGGYKSIGMIPKVLLSYNLDDGKAEILANPCYKAAPYATFDGMNEKGLFVALLNVTEARDIWTGHERVWPIEGDSRNIIMMNIALRILLDSAANVQEAIEILKNFNTSGIYQIGGLHLYIADAYGSAVAYEIDSQRHSFTYAPVLTNHYIYDVDMVELLKQDLGYLYENEWSDYRLSYLTQKINERKPVIRDNPWTLDECKKLLYDVRVSQKPEKLEISAWSLIGDPFNCKIYMWQYEEFDKEPVVFNLKDWF